MQRELPLAYPRCSMQELCKRQDFEVFFRRQQRTSTSGPAHSPHRSPSSTNTPHPTASTYGLCSLGLLPFETLSFLALFAFSPFPFLPFTRPLLCESTLFFCLALSFSPLLFFTFQLLIVLWELLIVGLKVEYNRDEAYRISPLPPLVEDELGHFLRSGQNLDIFVEERIRVL